MNRYLVKKTRLIDFGILVFCLLLLFTGNSLNMLPIIGCFLIIISVLMCIKSKRNKYLLMMVGIIAFINISLGYTDCIKLGEGVSDWQSAGLRSADINVICAKSVLLNMAILNMFLSGNVLNESEEHGKFQRKRNGFIAYGGIVLLFLILVYSLISIKITFGQYDSVENPIFEYSLIIVVFVWYYGEGYKLVNGLLWVFAILFTARFIIIGDRSSAFMLLVLLAILYFGNKIGFRHIIMFIAVGVPITNVVAIFRSNGIVPANEMLSILLEKGYYVDTVSWAYYAGLAVASLYYRVANPLYIGIGFFLRCIGIDNVYSNLNEFARSFSDLYNNGGGLYSSYFYAFGGYIGVIIGGIILGVILKKMFGSLKKESFPLMLVMITYTFRWYLYDPTTLFRGCLIFAILISFVCRFIHQITNRNHSQS